MITRLWLALFLFISLVAGGVNVPTLTSELVDTAGLLSNQEASSVRAFAARLNASNRVQLAILITPSLEELPIESYALEVSEKWKLGQKGVDNGLLLVIAPNEKRMRFEVGYGLEGDLPDIVAKRILSDELAPYFRERRFGDGIQIAIESVAQRLNIDLKAQVDRKLRGRRADPKGSLAVWLFLALLVLIIVISASGGGHGRSNWHGGSSGGWGGGGFGGGGFGGGGGGGFGGGGGGFGGGGASSGW